MLARLATLGVAVLAASVMACAGTRAPEAGSVNVPRDAHLTVQNEHVLDVTVYALRAGMRHRVGTVIGLKTETLRMPDAVVVPGSPVRLLAAPIGSQTSYASEVVYVHPGDRITFHVRNPLNLSYVRSSSP